MHGGHHLAAGWDGAPDGAAKEALAHSGGSHFSLVSYIKDNISCCYDARLQSEDRVADIVVLSAHLLRVPLGGRSLGGTGCDLRGHEEKVADILRCEDIGALTWKPYLHPR
jgi:hypothetical protein